MLVRRKSDHKWSAMAADGIEFCGLSRNETNGGAGLVRLKKGSRFPTHTHPGPEELLVLSGAVVIGGERLTEGDYLLTDTGEQHDAVAEEDTVFFVRSERGIEILDT